VAELAAAGVMCFGFAAHSALAIAARFESSLNEMGSISQRQSAIQNVIAEFKVLEIQHAQALTLLQLTH